MINAYPITALISYQTHKDYYRVSKVSAITGGKTSTSRQPLDLSYDQSAYKQLAKSAAKGLTGFVQSAQNVKQSAQTLVESQLPLVRNQVSFPAESMDNKAVTKPIREFQTEHSPLKPYGQYRSKLQAYLPVQMNGLLLDQRL
jgi:hypothetical protein